MNPRILSRSIGILLLLLAGAMGGCLLLGFLMPVSSTHNPETELAGWLISLAATAITGGALFILGRRHEQQVMMIRKEAIAMVGISWVACSFFASLPYLICPPHLAFDRALFESVSGLTTTGATVFAEIESLPKTILLWRSVTQWLGGMGILGMFVLVLSGIGASGKTLFGTESSTHSTGPVGRQRPPDDTIALVLLLRADRSRGAWHGAAGYDTVPGDQPRPHGDVDRRVRH